MKGWKTKTVKELSYYINRGIPPLYSDDGILIVNQKCIRDNRITLDEARYSNRKKKISDDKMVQLGDILINSTGIGTLGRTAQVKELNQETSVDTHVTIVRPNQDVNKWYLGYQIAFREPILDGLGQGSTQQTELSRDDIAALKIPYPSIEIQEKIVYIISAYENMIENNLKRIKLLEEMAQITFNDWFAKERKLPKGWNETNLGSLVEHEIGGGWGEETQNNEFNHAAYVIRGTDMYDIPIGKLDDVPFRYHKKSNLASRKLQDGDIVFEVSGGSSFEGVAKTLFITDELLKQFNGDVICASFCKLLRPKTIEFSNFTFLFLRFLREVRATEVFEIRSASNIVNYNWTAFLKFQKVKVPDEKTLRQFNKIIDPIYKQIYTLGHQNHLLKEARDILLPRLMAGIIEVEEAETKVISIAQPKQKEATWEFKEAVLISLLTEKFGSEKFPLGRKRYTKLSYLFHRHADNQMQNYLRKAAGPYNPKTKYAGPEKIAHQNGYVADHKNGNLTGFIAGKNIAAAKTYFENYWSIDYLNWLDTNFHYKSNDQLELYATVDNAMLELYENDKPVNVEAVKQIIKTEKEWKAKLEREIFSDTNIQKAITWLPTLFTYQIN